MTATIPPARSSRRPRSEDDFYPTSDGKPMAETELHLHQMFYLINGLAARYVDDPNVYVCGNNFLYYERNNPRAVVSPDCYVVFGVPKLVRDTFKVWEENGRTPDVIFEITSKKTKKEDTNTKRPVYERILRVSEYFLFDPTGDYLRPSLQGYRLVEGRYESIPVIAGKMRSEQLGLDLIQEGKTLRLFDPVRGIVLLTPIQAMQRVELEAKRAELEAQRAELEGLRANEEAQRAESAEAENARLRAELAMLREGKQPS